MIEAFGDYRYTKTHEWVRREEDGSVTVGITAHAEELLGDMVYVQLPGVGQVLAAEEECGVVESVKAASDIYCPLAGEVVAVNMALDVSPESINKDPYGDGWILRLRPADPADFDALLDRTAYSTLVAEEEH
ncbi:glycine cleavage system H protein [Gammaproteobacteria bacterium]